jgi:AraC-like DNA-binding protein
MQYRQTPSLEPAIYPTNLVAALVGVLGESGVPADTVLQGSDIAAGALLAPDTRISYRQIVAVFSNAARLAPNPALALQAGLRMHFAAYGVVGYAVLSSMTHASGAALAIKYSRLVGPLSDIDLEQQGDTAVWVYEPIFWHDPGEALYRLATELHMASHITVLSNLYGPAIRISGLRLAYAEPAHVQAYQAIFQCPLQFGQPRNELRYDLHHMDEPMAFSNAVTNAAVEAMCERHLAEVSHSTGLAAQVQRCLIEHPGRFPDVNAMATELAMHPRMLRRRLALEGSSYRQILAEVRRSLALSYLRQTALTHEEIASRLGYSDSANFRHAFIRWTGKNPSAFRGK